MSSNSPSSWHTVAIDKTLQQLSSNKDAGLSSQQVSERLQQYGPNELEETGGRSPWSIFVDQFTNIMLLMLMGVAVISAFLDIRSNTFPKDAIAIFTIVILNGILGFFQEQSAEKALAALKNLASPLVRVLRDGKTSEIAAKELVPGDVMLLEAGVKIAADGRLIESSNLQVRESALTGEALAVTKQAELELPEDASLGDRLNLIFQGTEVVQGRAKAIVTNTGMQTELGKIATMLQSVESEPTPLQQRMSQLGNVLVSGALILVAIVVIGGMITFQNGSLGFDTSRWEELLEVSLSMAVAVVPEGLAAVVTVTLALGTRRMGKRNALIRKLPAVETLGSVTTICSDKTGTLTQNKMVVQKVATVGQNFSVTGQGYAPTGEFTFNSQSIRPEQYPELQTLLIACVVCNDALLQQEDPQSQAKGKTAARSNSASSAVNWIILGDPTEGALLSLAGKGGLDKENLKRQLKRVEEFPFSSERKRMSVICEGSIQNVAHTAHNSPFLMFTKGSPELILERCRTYQLGDAAETLSNAQREQILAQNNQMAGAGLRVLGFAYKPLDAKPPAGSDETTEQDLIWLGLVGMLDAPRPEVRDAVARCRDAGIRAVMITGDHQLTAQAIAQDLGIAKVGDRVLTGKELQRLSQEELEQQVDDVSIYARVSPEHKLRIVQALQSRGKFTAMTGDGVNDAPALKQADIGIAMGITGTDVSKEASDMVLLDDNFATIVHAVEEGRVVYSNIRRFIKYILGSNIGEVLVIAAAPIIGLGGVPLTPLQILWMNLVTDGLPALALAVEPPEPDVMKRPPFSPRENIFARGLGSYMVRIGIVFAIISIALMVWAYNYTHAPGYQGNPEAWKTMVFTTLCVAQMGHALAVRSINRLVIEVNPFSNPYLLWAVVVTTGLQLALVYVPPLQSFFGTHYLR